MLYGGNHYKQQKELALWFADQMDSQGKPLYDITCVIWRRWQGFKLWDIKERDNLHLFKMFGLQAERPTFETLQSWLYDWELTLFVHDV